MTMDETTLLMLSAVAAILSALFAAWQIMLTRKTAMYNAVSGLSCHYYSQNQEWPKDFNPDVPGEWSDLEVVFRLDNVSDFPFTAVTAVLDLPYQQLRAFVDWVPPHSVLYCKAGFADEHEFMHRDTVTAVRLTFVDSSGLVWQRSPESKLKRRRFWLRRRIWRLWLWANQWLRDSLPTWLRPRTINDRGHYGATLAGVGQRFDANSTSGEAWSVFKPSQETINQDLLSAPPHDYQPPENESASSFNEEE